MPGAAPTALALSVAVSDFLAALGHRELPLVVDVLKRFAEFF
ncbi:hypothetical protein SAMN02927895_05309 [Belnapia rosea]|nr:hypothetical protein SAMN02927895_05309 [Belnapia rosea]